MDRWNRYILGWGWFGDEVFFGFCSFGRDVVFIVFGIVIIGFYLFLFFRFLEGFFGVFIFLCLEVFGLLC